ncbi:hypothetical protein WDZ92_28495 [Nostoc sp. NIES-2111]
MSFEPIAANAGSGDVLVPDTTTPVIAPMKASRKAKKRGTGSSEDM